jgi:hypothetical protein
MEEVTEFIIRVALQFVKMQYFPISRFLYKYRLSSTMLVAHGKIVVKRKLNGRRNPSALVRLPYQNILPLVLPTLLR